MTFTLEKANPEVLPSEVALREAILILSGLMNDTNFLGSHVLPLLEETAEDWYVAFRQDSPDGIYSLQIFVWPPGSQTQIHDHSSWGAFFCAAGSVLEERYERLDDGSVHDLARLRESWRRVWRKDDGISTVLPYDGGIHRVGNRTGGLAISVHLYGPRMGDVDGRDYDPFRDYVCDRQED